MDRERARRIAAPLLIVLAVLALVIAEVALYADNAIFSADEFADRASSTLSDSAVRTVVADRVSTEVIRADPDVIGAKPVIETVADSIVGSAAFQSVFRSALRDVHRSVFEGDRDTVTLALSDVGVLIVQALQTISPATAAKIPPSVQANLLSVSDGTAGFATDLGRAAENVKKLGWIALTLAILLFAAAIAVATERRRAIQRIGLSLAVAGSLVVVALAIGRSVVASRFEGTGSDASRAVWDAFLFDLRAWNLVLAASGAILAAAAASLLRPIDLTAVLRRAWETAATTPETPWRRALRAGVLIAAGLFIVTSRDTALALAALGFGLALLYLGVAELLRLTLPEQPEGVLETVTSGAGRRWRQLRPVLAGALAIGLIGVAVAAGAATDDPEKPPVEISACNGHAQLCDRTLDQVSFPSTHNSMSAADQPGWLFAGQEKGINSQLGSGVRGLLIDTHYGVRTPRGVYTILQPGSKSRAKLADELGEEFVSTAERLRARIGYTGGGKPEVYLCHGYCEVGATNAITALRGIRDFLVANPSEVLMVSIEDDVSPQATDMVFKSSGLLDLVWKGEAGPVKFPTLREMIEADERVFVMGENDTRGVPWYHQQFDITQETPYEFKTAAAVDGPTSCDLNRGSAGNRLYLVNNWVETTPAALPSNARIVNARDHLLPRAQRCRKARERLPNLIAVDFYGEGDVLGVADALNRVR